MIDDAHEAARNEAYAALVSDDLLTEEQVALLEAWQPGCTKNARRRRSVKPAVAVAVLSAQPRPEAAPEEWLAPIAPDGLGMPRDLMQSPTFSIAKHVYYDASRTLAAGYSGSLVLHGVQPTQDDLGVLYALIDFHRGKRPDEWLSFTPRTFARDVMRRSDSKHWKKIIIGALLTLSSFKLIRKWHPLDKAAEALSVIQRYKHADDGTISVLFDPTILNLFRNLTEFTFISLKERVKLRPGLQTWLYDFIMSTDCRPLKNFRNNGGWTTAWFHRMCGASEQQSLKEFGREMRKALQKLQVLGFILGFDITRGRVSITPRTRIARAAALSAAA